MKNAENSVSELLDFKIFWGGGGGETCPQTPLAAHTFGDRRSCHVYARSLATVLQRNVSFIFFMFILGREMLHEKNKEIDGMNKEFQRQIQVLVEDHRKEVDVSICIELECGILCYLT